MSPPAISAAAWDRVRNVASFDTGSGASDPIAAPLTLPEGGVSAGGASSLHYYVRFSLRDGTTLTADGNTLFGLDGFSLSDDQTLSIGSATTGAGAGKVTFNPLHLSFSQLGLDPKLFLMLSEGTTFKEVDVLGYKTSADGSHLVVDYSFGLVGASKLAIDQTGKTDLELQYGSQEIQQYHQRPDGSYDPTPDATAWDRVRNVAGFDTGSGASDPIAAPLRLPEGGVSAGGASSLHYYVRFSLRDGTTLTADGNTLFGLDGFSLSDDQTLSIGSATTGAGAGKVTFNPLHLSFSQLGLDPKLFLMLSEGTTFKEVDVLGYKTSADGSHLVVDYSFGLVGASKLAIDQTGKTDLELQYGSQEIQQYHQRPDGSYDPTPDATAWDRVRNVAGFDTGSGASDPIAAPLRLPEGGVSAGGASSLHYYVRFSLRDGTTLTADGNTLFGLDGFSLSDDQTLSIGSATTGAGAGKVTFNPLHLSFSQLGLDPKLFLMLSEGTTFKEVDVLGYKTSADGSHLVVDYSFGLVGASKLAIDQTGKTDLELQYGSQEIQQYHQRPDGSYDPTPDATAWDRVRNVAGFDTGSGASDPIAAPLRLPEGGVSAGGASSLHYYVRFSLRDGTTLTADGNTLFGLDGFSLSDDQTLSIGSATTGAGAGKVTFNPLHLSFSQLGLDPKLFLMLSEGTTFKEVDVLGYKTSADGSHLVVDYSFGLVGASKLAIDASGETQLELQYGSQEIQVFSSNQAPVAQNGSIAGEEDHAIVGQVAASDRDAFPAALGYALVTGPAHGQIDFHA